MQRMLNKAKHKYSTNVHCREFKAIMPITNKKLLKSSWLKYNNFTSPLFYFNYLIFFYISNFSFI